MFSQFAGSVYEKVNISGVTLEFDIMFVKTTNDFEEESHCARNVYVYLKPKEAMCTQNSYNGLPDKKTRNGVWHATKYRNYFFCNVSKCVRSMKESLDIKLIYKKHGFAKQLSVMKDSKVWFYVDLVPAVEVGKFSQ